MIAFRSEGGFKDGSYTWRLRHAAEADELLGALDGFLDDRRIGIVEPLVAANADARDAGIAKTLGDVGPLLVVQIRLDLVGVRRPQLDAEHVRLLAIF